MVAVVAQRGRPWCTSKQLVQRRTLLYWDGNVGFCRDIATVLARRPFVASRIQPQSDVHVAYVALKHRTYLPYAGK